MKDCGNGKEICDVKKRTLTALKCYLIVKRPIYIFIGIIILCLTIYSHREHSNPGVLPLWRRWRCMTGERTWKTWWISVWITTTKLFECNTMLCFNYFMTLDFTRASFLWHNADFEFKFSRMILIAFAFTLKNKCIQVISFPRCQNARWWRHRKTKACIQ